MKKEFENIFEKIKRERDWKIFEQNNKSTALNVLFSSKDSEEITLLYKSEYNLERKKLSAFFND